MMNPVTNFFNQRWQASATDETNGYMNNWRIFDASKTIRLLHVSLITETRVAHARLFVTSYSGLLNRIWDDDIGINEAGIWNGSMVLRNCTSVGAQILNPLTNDWYDLYIIWEELP